MPHKDPEARKQYTKQRYVKNKARLLAQMKERYAFKRDEVLAYQRAYYQQNTERVKANVKAYKERLQGEGRLPNRDDYFKQYRKENAPNISINAKAFRRSNPSVVAAWNRRYIKSSINYQIAIRLRSRINRAVKRTIKQGSGVKDLGCSLKEFKNHIAAKFTDGMSWENFGQWHIDHIRPLASFNLADREQFVQACHYTNLQPLWAAENMAKGAKLDFSINNMTYNKILLNPPAYSGASTEEAPADVCAKSAPRP